MSQEVKLILASVADGVPIYTIRARYWRAIHAEVMTHRAFNRNAGSSRAIPVKRMLDMVVNDTAGPVHWGQNQAGMQAEKENDSRVIIPKHLWQAFAEWVDVSSDGICCVQDFQSAPDSDVVDPSREAAWAFSAWLAAQMSGAFSDAGYHKQIANRPTEPYQWITTVITATAWQNFFDLRAHPGAMPEFRMLAEEIRDVIAAAKPQYLQLGDWHIPYILPAEDLLPLEVKLKLSTARCASTSYQTVEGDPMTLDKAEGVYAKLLSSPLHASPFEHQACNGGFASLKPRWASSLRAPWVQHRKYIENRETPT